MTIERLTNRGIPGWAPWLVAQGVINSVYCRLTVFGTVFVLFLNALGLSNSSVGLALSLIPFTCLLGLVVAPTVARFGFKRAYVLGFGVRNVFVALILFAPWIAHHHGLSWAFAWIAANLLGFAFSRAFGEMGMYPWFQEVIPNPIRSRLGAVTSTLGTAAALVASAVAGGVIGHGAGISRYLDLMGVGAVLGLAATACLLFVPGGDPVSRSADEPAHLDAMRSSLRDRRYVRYLAGFGIVTLTMGALLTFVPLYMRERVGLPAGAIVLLEVAGSVGGLIGGYPAGRAADRRGSRPVLVTSVALLVLLPLCWAFMPQRSSLSFAAAMAISLLSGIANTAWLIGADRYLNVCAVPLAKRTPYMAVYYALAGVAAGAGPLMAGRLVDAFSWLGHEPRHVLADPYVPLFALSAALLLIALGILFRVPDFEADAARPSPPGTLSLRRARG